LLSPTTLPIVMAIGDTVAVGIHTLIQHPSPNEYKGKYFSPG
jgi:hypothetical protein